MRGPDDLYLRLQAHKGRKHQALLVHTPQITWRGNKRRYHTHIRLDQKPISRYLIRISPTKRSDCSYSRPLLCTGEQQGAFGYTITWSRLLRGPDDLYLRLQAHRGIKHQALHVNTSQITWRDTKRWYHTRIRLDHKPISGYIIKIPPTKRSDCSCSRSPLCTGEQ